MIKIFLPSQHKINITQGLDAAWVVAARQKDDDYKEKIRQVSPFSIPSFRRCTHERTMRLQSPTSQAGQMLRGAGGGQGAPEAVVASRQPEEVPA